MTNQTQPKLDPALAEHLQELAAMAKEIGAGQIVLIRNTTEANLIYRLPGDPQFGPARDLLTELRQVESTVNVSISNSLTLPNSGTLMLLHFPASDGSSQTIELL